MNYFISEERCDRCQLCVSACPSGAIYSSRQEPAYLDRLRTGGEFGVPTISQDECDGCEARIVPPCIAVCDLGAIRVNMLV